MKRIMWTLALLGVQPAQAQEVVLKCTGISDMKIYNPHGRGGVIGGPSPKNFTLRTDGKTLTHQTGNDAPHTARNLQITPQGLSFCWIAASHECEVDRPVYQDDGFARTSRSSFTTVSAGGTYHFEFMIMTTNARMKTGVTVQENGRCDEEGMAALRKLMNPEPEKPSKRTQEVGVAPSRPATSQASAIESRASLRAERDAKYEAELAEYKRLAREREEAIRAAEQQKIANQKAAEAAGQRAAEAQRRYEAEAARHKEEVERARRERERWQQQISARPNG